ncbi:DUF445 domain-containing protein [Staphylococcus argenteus]|uniref:DUF445 domain-containing protein n=1 Tax=Staphylococcus argenteus TaxID=985002 RepID=UPI001FBBD159|nr:DUF445 domain-containing protein [Staphylococcus argenteus]MCG9794881.1 DUF445 family protein [Staphylococcus argenteus]GJF45328.1 DUF445 domain-containing protein [Staphylococcus argenteus]GJF55706.1 DUF445 domain-containing protein [Staphylococcus argenteus]GJF60926.1 DUF445 domain-containing protein [Staphylococcus argenteus]GJF72255.1 DUF445 domain-containing protein [Staphylococcus argenteus]
MNALFIITFMIVVGAIIGGITNVIAIRMLFHPFIPYYIFKFRVPFTPGLIPKRREEIATKIGQVIEEHLLTESLISEKLKSSKSQEAIHSMIQKQLQKISKDQLTIQQLTSQFDIDLKHVLQTNGSQYIESQLNRYYQTHQDQTIVALLPNQFVTLLDNQVDKATDLLCDRARNYLSSAKGTQDINDMLDTFFNEKGKLIGMLQMFMTKESIADRIQQELIRLTSHPKARGIVTSVISNEYETFKNKPLNELINTSQFDDIAKNISTYLATYINNQSNKPIVALVPNFIDYLENQLSAKLTDLVILQLSKHLSTIMTKVDLRGLIEEQINTFELDYIEKLIIEIANKELKLIMSLGFILGGIIGFFQGLVAIFV